MAYAIAVGQGWVSRSDFWDMPVAEFWWLFAAKNPDFDKPEPSDMSDVVAHFKAVKAKEARELNA